MAAVLFLCFHADVTTAGPCQQSWPLITDPLALSGDKAKFWMTTNDVHVSDWRLHVGTKGPDSTSIGSFAPDTPESHYVSVSGLDTKANGRPIFVRLLYQISGSSRWPNFDFQYPAVGLPTIVSPIQNSSLCEFAIKPEFNPTIRFAWDPNGTKVDEWQLIVGPYPNHDYGYVNNFQSDEMSAYVPISMLKLPKDASYDGKLYAHLWYRIGKVWYCAGDRNDRYNCVIYSYFPID
jgi:hypothetical protein